MIAGAERRCLSEAAVPSIGFLVLGVYPNPPGIYYIIWGFRGSSIPYIVGTWGDRVRVWDSRFGIYIGVFQITGFRGPKSRAVFCSAGLLQSCRYVE